MFQKAAFPGKYIQGVGAIGELPALLHVLGTKGLLVASPTVRGKILPACGLGGPGQAVRVETFRGECCADEVARLSALVKRQRADVLVGMGGGKTLDTAKIVADRAAIPVIIIPTIASTDAPCSGCAVLYSREGQYESVSYQKTNPAVVLVDVGIIAAAPTRFLVAGMGDALATWFEARSCERTHSPNECGGTGTAAGFHLARLCYDTLLAHGAAARMASENGIVTPALEHIIEANILLSGVGFESAGLAAAHAIHNGLTALAETHAFYHGEKVAFGVLAGLHLADAPAAESAAVHAFCREIGLPTTLADIGLRHAGREDLMRAAEKACASGSSLHHEAGVMTPARVLNALLAADAMGRAREGRRTVQKAVRKRE